MNIKIKSFLLVLAIIFTVFVTSSKADELPILPNKTFWLPIAPHSIQTITTPFSAIDIDSTYQITVTKALPAPYKSKIYLHQTCVQNSLILDSIPANTKDELQIRVYSDEITAGQETLFRFILGPIEKSSSSVTGMVYVYPTEKKSILFTIDSKDVLVNNKNETMDVGPVIVQGRTYVPFRYLSTVFGALVTYTMDPTTKLVNTVTYKLGNFSLTLAIGSNDYEVQVQNEKQIKTSDGKPFILKGRTLVPLRLISESLCSEVGWNPTDRVVHIQFPRECSPDVFQDIFYHNITAEDVNNKIQTAEPVTIIDLRTKDDYDKGHIPSAVNIHISSLKSEMAKEIEREKTKQIIVYCKSGAQSLFGSEILVNLGYTNIWNLTLGFSSWKYETEKPE